MINYNSETKKVDLIKFNSIITDVSKLAKNLNAI